MSRLLLQDFSLLRFAFLIATLTSPVLADPVVLQFHPRTADNLLETDCVNSSGVHVAGNSSFDGSGGSWELVGDPSAPSYTSAQDHTGGSGSGSVEFTTVTLAGGSYAQLKSCRIPMSALEYDKPYTISFFIKSQVEPAYVEATLHTYNSANVRLSPDSSNGNALNVYSTSIGAASETGEWEEVTLVVTITDRNVAKVQVAIGYMASGPQRPNVFVDDVYFGRGISFANEPSDERDTFSSDRVEIDVLGNWRVKENGEWKDFFPFGLYPDLARTDYDSLSAAGFNLVLSQQYVSQVAKARDAEPVRMYAGLRLAKYARQDSGWPLTTLTATIEDILDDSTLADTLLLYDWDNEENWGRWSWMDDVASTLRGEDADRPIYMLNGYAAVQRLFSPFSDVAGTYVGYDSALPMSGRYANVGRFEVLQSLEKQRTPVSIAQLNSVEDTEHGFRLRVYDALIKGAKGIVYWGDDDPLVMGTNDRVENREWWDDVPNLREELDELLPILKQPHWTTWTAASSDPNILFGTRDYDDEGYLIVANPQATPSKVTFTLSGLSPTEAWDFLHEDAFVTLVQGGQFTVMLPAHSTAVYRLSTDAYAEMLPNVGMETADSPLSAWNDYGPGTFVQDGSVKYNGSYSAKISSASATADNTYLYYYGALQPGKTYRFTAMVKTDNVVKNNSGNAFDGAFIQLFASGGINAFLPTPALSGTNDWQLVQKTFVAPSPACLADSPPCPNGWYVRLRLWNASGEVWFDNVSLKELP